MWDGRVAPVPRRLTSQSCPPVRTGSGAIPRGRRHRGRGRRKLRDTTARARRFWFFGILVILSLGCSGHRPLCRPMKVSRISHLIVVTFMGTLTVLHRPRVPDPGGARAGWGRAAFPHWFCMYSCPAPPASQCITPMPIYHNIGAVPLIVPRRRRLVPPSNLLE